MNLWDGIVGQQDAVATLRAAAAAYPGTAEMTHAWLITGPPGSGRSNLAYAFAAALLSPTPGVDDAQVHQQVASRTHPDLLLLGTEGISIGVQEARALALKASFAAADSRYRVIVVEDADRMTEPAANALLKAIEEPPEGTVWVLCAPSEADVLPTIRSRVRSIVLHVPSVEDVARLLAERDGIDPARALEAAREAQSHIGMARRLASDDEARARRDRTVEVVLGIRTAGAAVRAAQELLTIADADASALTEDEQEAQEAELYRQLGLTPGEPVPPGMRTLLKRSADDRKAREKRAKRDGIDRVIIDLFSVYRDALLTALDSGESLVNERHSAGIQELASALGPAGALHALDALGEARERIAANVPPLLALEAALCLAVDARQSA